jgi:predicted transposase YbfD/YdcC
MMETASLQAYFSDLPDPREAGKCEHRLLDIVMIAICAVIANAESWEDIALFGEMKQDWLKQWLALPNGIPSHDTFERVFRKLNPEAFQECFMKWVQAVFAVTEGQVIAIDGKTVCGSKAGNGKAALHLVSAWASANGISLGQRKVKAKSNEITVIPDLLDLLLLKGCIVTLDAMGCQTDIAEKIVAQQADYVLAVKKNQGQLYQHLETTFDWLEDDRNHHAVFDYAETVERGHGRLEQRQCWVVADHAAQADGWVGCQTLVRLICQRELKGEVERETRYYISSLPPRASLLLGCIRAHWSIENSFHWVLDAVFQEDRARTRNTNGAENLALLRRIALNLVKKHPAKGSLKGKRHRAAWNDDFLLQVLQS